MAYGLRKTLVTHLYPHLDDVAGLWLLKRFDPAFRNARMKFVPTSAGGLRLAAGEIGVGVGLGKYDEHKGNRKDSATSLIWKDLKRRGRLPGSVRGRAIADFVDYVRRGDLGEFIGRPENYFNFSAIFQEIAGLPGEDSRSATEIGFRVIDALALMYEERIIIGRAIARGKKFMTGWGRGIALTTDARPGTVVSLCAERGYAVTVLQHPSREYLHVRANPHVRADLTRLAEAVRASEPDSEWFFHHSKKMLLHGDLVAPTKKRTKLTVNDMIRLILKLYA